MMRERGGEDTMQDVDVDRSYFGFIYGGGRVGTVGGQCHRRLILTGMKMD